MTNHNAVARYSIYGMSLIAFAAVSMVASADDEVQKPDEKPPASSAPDADPKKPSDPKEKSLLEKLGDELMKEVDDTPGADPDKEREDVDKMERAVKGMRSAGEKLDEGQTADETQKIQKQVIKDLEDIINQLENPPPNQGEGGAGGGGGGGGGGTSGRSGRGGGGSSLRRMRPQGAGGKGRSSAQAQQRPGDGQEQAGGTSSENGVDSSKMSQADRKATEEAGRKQKLEMDVWGHLPQHVREELLNTYGERILPKYEHLVKQFYEALSTQGTAKKK